MKTGSKIDDYTQGRGYLRLPDCHIDKIHLLEPWAGTWPVLNLSFIDRSRSYATKL